MTNEEAIAILIAHRQGVEGSKDFEAFKTHQLAYIDMLINEKADDTSRQDKILNWILKVETKTDD